GSWRCGAGPASAGAVCGRITSESRRSQRDERQQRRRLTFLSRRFCSRPPQTPLRAARMARKGQRKRKAVIGDPTDPDGFSVWLRRYLDALRVKNYSERTIENRDVYLRFFIEWCEARGIVRARDVTKPMLERYCCRAHWLMGNRVG